jgi:hypothetical protein
MVHFHVIHGLRIASELQLPEIAYAEFSGCDPDVCVRLAPLPDSIDDKASSTRYLRVVGSDALLVFENTMRFLVRNGREIFIDIPCGADLAVVRSYLFGHVMGMICAQRGLLALHASAVAFENRVFAFAGPPRAGKSTLAAHCLSCGATLVSDDFLVVSLLEGSPPLAKPGMQSVKLWKDALINLGLNSEGLRPDWYRADKFHLPVEFVSKTLPLARLFVLEHDDTAGVAQFQRLTGARAIDAIIANTYRLELVDVAGGRVSHFRQCAGLAQQIEVIALRRGRRTEHLALTALRVLSQKIDG